MKNFRELAGANSLNYYYLSSSDCEVFWLFFLILFIFLNLFLDLLAGFRRHAVALFFYRRLTSFPFSSPSLY